MSEYFPVILSFTFALFITCTMVFFVSGAYLLLFKIRYANELFKHPYLAQRNFNAERGIFEELDEGSKKAKQEH